MLDLAALTSSVWWQPQPQPSTEATIQPRPLLPMGVAKIIRILEVIKEEREKKSKKQK